MTNRTQRTWSWTRITNCIKLNWDKLNFSFDGWSANGFYCRYKPKNKKYERSSVCKRTGIDQFNNPGDVALSSMQPKPVNIYDQIMLYYLHWGKTYKSNFDLLLQILWDTTNNISIILYWNKICTEVKHVSCGNHTPHVLVRTIFKVPTGGMETKSHKVWYIFSIVNIIFLNTYDIYGNKRLTHALLNSTLLLRIPTMPVRLFASLYLASNACTNDFLVCSPIGHLLLINSDSHIQRLWFDPINVISLVFLN